MHKNFQLARNYSLFEAIERRINNYFERSDIISSQERKVGVVRQEKSEILVEMEKLWYVAERRTQSLLQMRHSCNVRGALEFIRAQITEPNDKSLVLLSRDEDFTKNLKKACEDNFLRYDDVRRSLGGLYYTASKSFHGHENEIIIDSRTWISNEVFLLGVIFRHTKFRSHIAIQMANWLNIFI
ncbi:7009_t:CDS:2, partial [Ambispora gerdemannii]